MFTGIIEGLGTVAKLGASGRGKRLAVAADFELKETRVGDSVSVNGACLTAIAVAANRFEADLSPETLAKTAFGRLKTGDRVNLERALRLSDRLDGHLVSGHIDGVGAIAGLKKQDNAVLIAFTAAQSLLRHIIVKGSIAVDGVSLTVNNVSADGFEVSIIPHTARLTTLGFKRKGDPVNIETDLIGKYVERFLTAGGVAGREALKKSGIDLEFLAKAGFI